MCCEKKKNIKSLINDDKLSVNAMGFRVRVDPHCYNFDTRIFTREGKVLAA